MYFIPVSSDDATPDKPEDQHNQGPETTESTERPSPADSVPAPQPEPVGEGESPVQVVERSESQEAPESEQSPASSSEMPSKKEDEEEPLTETGDKPGASSSGEDGEEEDEGEVEDEKQKKKKKRKGILNVHFPHFGAKKSRSTDSDSDHAVSPKRFGWKRRKDAKSPERRDDTNNQEEGKEVNIYQYSSTLISTNMLLQYFQFHKEYV